MTALLALYTWATTPRWQSWYAIRLCALVGYPFMVRHDDDVQLNRSGVSMTKDERALFHRAMRLGYNVRRVNSEYALTAMDGSGDGCVGGSSIERIHQWLDQKERCNAAEADRFVLARTG
jgi:hypothetical protein